MAGIPQPNAPYAVPGGAIFQKAGASYQGISETFNKSRSDTQLQADGWTLSQPGTCDISEDSSDLIITSDSATRGWGSSLGYSAPYIRRSFPMPAGAFFVYTKMTGQAGKSSIGYWMEIRFGDTNGQFVQVGLYASATWDRYFRTGPTPTAVSWTAGGGAQTMWCGMRFERGRMRPCFANQTAEPTDDEWDFPYTNILTPSRTWSRLEFDVQMSLESTQIVTGRYGKLVLRFH